MDEEEEKDIIGPETQAADQIGMTGEKDIGEKVLQESKLCIEFNLGKEAENFKGREQMLRLSNHLALVNTTVYTKLFLDGTEWMNDKVFPAGGQFMKETGIRQQTNGRGYVTMIAYIMVVYTKKWNHLKYLEVVMNHIKKYNIWMYINEFDTKKVGSPGFITELRHQLTNLDALKFEMERNMMHVNCNDERVVEKWKLKNEVMNTKENKIPKFALLQRIKGQREAPKRIKSWVVIIQSAAEDATYLKTLISAVYNKKMMSKGNFVMQGMVKIAGEEAYKQ
eukprot:8500836-Ditylum_brightwellii.AAC.1